MRFSVYQSISLKKIVDQKLNWIILLHILLFNYEAVGNRPQEHSPWCLVDYKCGCKTHSADLQRLLVFCLHLIEVRDFGTTKQVWLMNVPIFMVGRNLKTNILRRSRHSSVMRLRHMMNRSVSILAPIFEEVDAWESRTVMTGHDCCAFKEKCDRWLPNFILRILKASLVWVNECLFAHHWTVSSSQNILEVLQRRYVNFANKAIQPKFSECYCCKVSCWQSYLRSDLLATCRFQQAAKYWHTFLVNLTSLWLIIIWYNRFAKNKQLVGWAVTADLRWSKHRTRWKDGAYSPSWYWSV